MCCGVCFMPTEWIEKQLASPRMKRPFRLEGRHVMILLIGFFAIVAASNAVMLTAAIKTMPGLDARNGYDPSQAYNGEIAAAQRQDREGYSASVSLVRSGDGIDARFTLASPSRRNIDGDATLRLEHPSDRKRDIETTLQAQGNGVFSAHLAGVSAGARNLVIELRDAAGERIYRDQQRVMIGGGS
jgi:nitrogen fixation protein FixH